jgi:hypothetical protein
VSIVHLAVDLVVRASVSMRGAAASLALMTSRCQLDIPTPSFGAIRSWLLRIGCYALTRALPMGAWLLLVDHTVQIGSCKLLVILGCPMDKVPFGERALQHADLSLVGLALMEKSNDKTVSVELEKARLRVGEVRQIASDQGTDLDAGVKLFQQNHPGVAHVHDLAHQAANVLKQRRGRDETWSEFVSKLAQSGLKVRQTSDAHLCPPTVRAKARFMNVASTLRFAGRVLKLLDRGGASARAEESYGWLREYRESLLNWTSEQTVVEVALEHVRHHGVSSLTVSELDAVWSELSLTPGACEVAARLRGALRREGSQAKAGERLVGSTEVLESVLGKWKRLEGDYSGDGFTGLSLSLGALVGDRTEAETREALESVPKKESEGIVRRVIGKTVQMMRGLFVKGTEA